MRRLWAFLILILSLQALQAKVFMHHPGAKEGDEVWFRSTFVVNALPDSVILHLSTSGYALAYVNGRIAFPETIWPYRPLSGTIKHDYRRQLLRQYKQGVATRDIDVTHLLRRGRNVIAVWYAPCINVKAMLEAEKAMQEAEKAGRDTDKADAKAEKANALPDSICGSSSYEIKPLKGSSMQISASLTAFKDNKKETLVREDAGWLCHIASGRMTLEGEEFDATKYLDEWKTLYCHIDPSWVAAERTWMEEMEWNTLDDIGLSAFRTTRAKINRKALSRHTYYIPSEATGLLRITLRDTSKGQRIIVNGMEYRCFGTNDEQIYTRFATLTTDCITIESGDGKPFPDIQTVEFIELRQTTEKEKNTNCFLN